MTNLIERLRETASKGVSVWGDLQMEAADTIEALSNRNRQLVVESSKYCAEVSRGMSDTIRLMAERDNLRAEVSKLDVLLEKCKMDWSGDVTQIKAEHKHEVDTLRQQLAEAQALIEASQKQEVVAWIKNGFRFRFSRPNTEPPLGWDALYTAPVVAPDVPNMFWNADDNEKMHTSISEFLNDEICNGTPLEVGAIFTIQQAKRLPDIRIKVTSIDDNECEADYEVIDAAIGGAND